MSARSLCTLIASAAGLLLSVGSIDMDTRDIHFVPSSMPITKKMIELAAITKDAKSSDGDDSDDKE